MLSTDLLPPDLAEDDPLLDAAAELEKSAHTLDLEDWIIQRLKHADRETTVNIALQKQAGAVTCTAYRVQHARAHRHCLGPVHLTPVTHLAELRAAALDLTLQYALLDLPLGGSAGAILCDPAHLSEPELRHLIRHYLACLDVRGDIFAPAECPGAWTSAARHLQNAALVGKHATVGGLPDAASAIAQGWLTLIAENIKAVGTTGSAVGTTESSPALQCRDRHSSTTSPVGTAELRGFLRNAPGCCVSIQGAGASAMKLARMLHQGGATLIGLADKSGGLFRQEGLDIPSVNNHLTENRMLYGFPGADAVSNADVLESNCDVLVLAAAERQVNVHNAARIKAKLVLEAVDRAVTPSAASALCVQDVTVIPALLGTASRALSWFAEWQSGLRYESPDQKMTESMIRHKLEEVARQVSAFAAEQDMPVADSCRLSALKKFAAVMRLLN